jgi:hypothetical protein
MPRVKRPLPTPEEVEILTTHTLRESAAILGMSYDRVRRICVDNKIPNIRLRNVSPENWGNPSKQARLMWSEGRTLSEISRQTRKDPCLCCRMIGLPTLPPAMWHINRDVVDWLMVQFPKGDMCYNEFIGILLTEMFEEDK